MCPHIVGGHLDNLFELSINYEKNQIDLIIYIYIYIEYILYLYRINYSNTIFEFVTQFAFI
jgi:hypothetical protein